MAETALAILIAWVAVVLGVYSIPTVTTWVFRWKNRLEHPKQLIEWWIGEPVYLVAGRYVRWSKIPSAETTLGRWIRKRENVVFGDDLCERTINVDKIRADTIDASRIAAPPLFENE